MVEHLEKHNTVTKLKKCTQNLQTGILKILSIKIYPYKSKNQLKLEVGSSNGIQSLI